MSGFRCGSRAWRRLEASSAMWSEGIRKEERAASLGGDSSFVFDVKAPSSLLARCKSGKDRRRARLMQGLEEAALFGG
jgi:hypothetical protein